MSNENESVTPTETISDQTVTQTETAGETKYKNDLIRYKREAQELKDQLESINLQKEQKKGNFEGVISKLKADLAEAKQVNARTTKTFAEKALDDAIKTTAMSKGLKGQQLDAFIKLVDEDAKGVVEYDERFNIVGDDVNNLVDDHMKRYGELFKTKVNVVDQSPNNNPINRPTKQFDMNKATAQETLDYLLANKDKLK